MSDQKDKVSEVQIMIELPDLAQVVGHFGRCLPILFLYPSSACGNRIRKLLGMTPGDLQYFDPDGKDDCEKIITFLIEAISDDAKKYIRNNLPSQGTLKEVEQNVANWILVKSTPQQLCTVPPVPQQGNPVKGPVTPTPVTKIVTYPPPPQIGEIDINSDDMCCLNEGKLLNDVIIDFYLKYLMREKVSEANKKRTHVFSSFFYTRLTKKKKNMTREGEEDINTMAVQRHMNVKTWTKNVDIFEKDVIIIPINQNAHWFLAIICFPGSVSETLPASTPTNNSSKSSDCAISTNDGETCINPESSLLTGGPVKSTSGQACCTEDQSSGDGSSFSNDVNSSVSDDSVPDTPDNSTHPDQDVRLDKMPCILIFDSLCRPNHAPIVDTLREYLQVEWKIKKKTTRSFSKTSIAGYVMSVPQQENLTDCGVYVLQYVESFFENPFPYFGPRMPELSNWFPLDKIKNKRLEIVNIIMKIREDNLSLIAASRAGPTGKNNDNMSAATVPSSP